MILEGILSTTSASNAMHVAPMGPDVSEDFDHWTLKPYQSSATFSNLQRVPSAVFHVTDDSLLLARAVLGRASEWPHDVIPSVGFVLHGVSRWFSLQITDWNLDAERAIATAKVIDSRWVRPFFGWNRAKHAVLETAILASRVHLLRAEMLSDEIRRYESWVQKTGGSREREAFELLRDYIQEQIATK